MVDGMHKRNPRPALRMSEEDEDDEYYREYLEKYDKRRKRKMWFSSLPSAPSVGGGVRRVVGRFRERMSPLKIALIASVLINLSYVLFQPLRASTYQDDRSEEGNNAASKNVSSASAGMLTALEVAETAVTDTALWKEGAEILGEVEDAIFVVESLALGESEKGEEGGVTAAVPPPKPEIGFDDDDNISVNDMVGGGSIHDVECGVWLAETSSSALSVQKLFGELEDSIKALGLYAGRQYKRGTEILPGGDVVIPYFDLVKHQGTERAYSFPWEQFAWDSTGQFMNQEAIEVGVASPGVGSLLGCLAGGGNVEEGTTENGDALPGSLHRSKDMGAGAFTPFRRAMGAMEDITAGQEMVSSNLDRCEGIIESQPDSFQKFNTKMSRLIKESRVKKTTRPIQWLKDHGRCIDNVIMGPSSVPQAGMGAIAARRINKGDVAMPVPLLHFTDKTIMDMYGEFASTPETDGTMSLVKHVNGRQLLINYCFGHPETTVLLCPYGHGSPLVNHKRARGNVSIRWADPKKSLHRTEFLDYSVDDLEDLSAPMLAWEFVATRTIEHEEEIFLDYGQAWDTAWDKHAKSWRSPYDNSEKYKAAAMVNDGPYFLKLLKKKKVPKNMILLGDLSSFGNQANWRNHLATFGDFKALITMGSSAYSCTIDSWSEDNELGIPLFTAVFLEDKSRLNNVPAEAFQFMDMPYTTDIHLRDAFRHDIGIPDEILPDAWKNVGNILLPQGGAQ